MIENLHGLSYERATDRYRAYARYLSVLVPLLREGSIRFRGDFYPVDGGLVVPGASRWPSAGTPASPAGR